MRTQIKSIPKKRQRLADLEPLKESAHGCSRASENFSRRPEESSWLDISQVARPVPRAPSRTSIELRLLNPRSVYFSTITLDLCGAAVLCNSLGVDAFNCL